MKILVMGDFHGKSSIKFFRRLKKEKFDLIFSPGDFCGNEELGKLFFKYYYAKNKSEIRKIPKKIKEGMKILEKKSIMEGISVLKRIKEFRKPFYAVHGNWDPIPGEVDIGSKKYLNATKSDLIKFHKEFEKNFELVDFKVKDLGPFVLVGGTSSTHPGKVDKRSLKEFLNKYGEEDPKEAREIVRIKKKHHLKRKRKYEVVFRKAKKLKKPIIFLTHNSPYNTKLDVIRAKGAHKLAKGKHYGSYLEKLLIKRFKPDLVLCGHIHENFGKDKIGKTLVVNIGAVFENQAVIVDFPEDHKRKIKLKFIK